MASRYQTALLDPFSNAARGAKIPDMYAFPSDTYTVESEIIVSSDANGNFDFAVTPHPLGSVYTNKLTSLNGYSDVYAQGGGVGIVSSVNLSTFADKVDSYRIVSAGAKIESLLIPTVATGTLTMAHLPAVPSTVIPNQEIDNDVTDYLGLPISDASGYFDKNMRVLPTGHAMNVSEWQGTGLSSCLRVITPDALEFRRGSNKLNTGQGRSIINAIQGVDGDVNPISIIAPAANPALTIGVGVNITVNTYDNSQVKSGDILRSASAPIGTIYATSPTQVTIIPLLTFGSTTAWSAGATLYIVKQQNPVLTGANEEFIKQGGWSVLCVRGSGFPINTQCCTLRVAYNLETVDRNLTSITFLGGQPSPVDIVGFNQVLRNVQLLPYYRTLEQKLSPGDAAARRLGIA